MIGYHNKDNTIRNQDDVINISHTTDIAVHQQ